MPTGLNDSENSGDRDLISATYAYVVGMGAAVKSSLKSLDINNLVGNKGVDSS